MGCKMCYFYSPFITGGNMKNILVILVGGTICTSPNENGLLSVNEKCGYTLISNFENSDSAYKNEVKFTLSENLFILSENMTVEKLNIIFSTYKKHTENKKYDGIIFAHGTDTLAFSASVFSFLLSGTDIPVFFVGANKHLKSPLSNGNENFKYAIECICRGIEPNIYVAYKNLKDKKMYLHLASRINQCQNYTDDFYSVGMIDITHLTDKVLEKIKALYPKEKMKPTIDISKCPPLKECVLLITPYVGLNYKAFDFSLFSAVLHLTYHSGTACSLKECENSILYMTDITSKLGIDTYFSPAKWAGEIYETVGEIKNSDIDFLYGYTNEATYAKLLIAYSVFDKNKERQKFINEEINFEKID